MTVRIHLFRPYLRRLDTDDNDEDENSYRRLTVDCWLLMMLRREKYLCSVPRRGIYRVVMMMMMMYCGE
jgi:hypothetical protein